METVGIHLGINGQSGQKPIRLPSTRPDTTLCVCSIFASEACVSPLRNYTRIQCSKHTHKAVTGHVEA